MGPLNSLYTAMRFDFLYADRYIFSTGWSSSLETTPYCMVRLIEKGEALFIINSIEYMVHEGEVVYIPEGVSIYCEIASEQFIFTSIRFRVTARLDQGDFLEEYFGIRRITLVKDNSDVVSLFNNVLLNAVSKRPSKLFHIRGSLELIIGCLADQSDTQTTPVEVPLPQENMSMSSLYQRELIISERSRDPRINALIEYISNNPAEDYNSASLAEMADMSESSLRRLFRKCTGKSPIEYITELRLVIAARRLLVTHDRVSAIAYSVGIADTNYFSRVFRKTFGVSPQQYRRMAN